MGNHRFRLSDMIPNAWFYKLKDMGRTRNQNKINHTRKKKQRPITTSLSSTSSSSSSTTTNTAANPPQQSKTIQPHLLSESHQRKSYYYTRELTPPPPSNPIHNPKSSDTLSPELPRKSSKQSRSTRNRASSNVRSSPKPVTSSVSTACSCGGSTLESVSTKPNSTSEEYTNSLLDSFSDLEFGSDLDHDRDHGMVSWSSSCRCRVEKDIVIHTNGKSLNAKFDGFQAISISELELPPIVTKKPIKCSDSMQDIEKKKIDCNEPTKLRTTSAKSEERNAHGSLSVKVVKQDSINREQRTSSFRRHSVSSPGVRLRTHSPRIASRKIQAHARKSVSSSSSAGSRRSLSESFAVVKSSADPQSDFRNSMVEMILQNNIRASKDLEDLLTCYLQLNSDEYHELIIKVFKQIWFDLADVRL